MVYPRVFEHREEVPTCHARRPQTDLDHHRDRHAGRP